MIQTQKLQWYYMKLPSEYVLGRFITDSYTPLCCMMQAAIISLGLIGAGTNNARIAGMLRNLSSYYYKEASLLFCVSLIIICNVPVLTIDTKLIIQQVTIFLGLIGRCGLHRVLFIWERG